MIPFPNGKYSVIYADPPWRYSDRKCNGNAEDHYPTMKLEDICNLPVKDLAADPPAHTLTQEAAGRRKECHVCAHVSPRPYAALP